MTRAPNIDIAALRDALDGADCMVSYYDKAEEKTQQNAALKAAGLPLLHPESSLDWDLKQRERYRRQAEALRAVIALVAPAEKVAA